MLEAERQKSKNDQWLNGYFVWKEKISKTMKPKLNQGEMPVRASKAV